MTITPEEAEAMVALALEQAAEAINNRGAEEQRNFGLGRETQNFYRARNIVRALRPDAFAALSSLREADRAEIERLRAELRECRMQALADAAQDQMRAEALEADRRLVAETALRMAADVYAREGDWDVFGDAHAAILAITPAAALAAVDST